MPTETSFPKHNQSEKQKNNVNYNIEYEFVQCIVFDYRIHLRE